VRAPGISPVRESRHPYFPGVLVPLLILSGLLAGMMGALLGVGGGVVLVPLLVLGFKVPLEQAIPASLACVVAGSCGAAARYVENRLADIRLALTLELATVSGAILGGFAAGLLAPAVVAVALGIFLVYVSLQSLFVRVPEPARPQGYRPINYPLGLAGSAVAGALSAILGVGGGPLKVPLMSFGMRVPFKVASATSNLMIGVTGAASVTAYALRGHLRIPLVAPLVVGVLFGATLGSYWMTRVPAPLLKRIFGFVLLIPAAEMLWKGGTGLWPNLGH
jgi:uncharacterized protein